MVKETAGCVMTNLEERLDILEAKINVLLGVLIPNELLKILEETIKDIENRNWESRMGEDL
jgi:hypothetical protein